MYTDLIFIKESSKNIRGLARYSLKGFWKLAIIATAVFLVAELAPPILITALFGDSIGTSLSGLYNLLTGGAFSLGYIIFSLRLLRRQEPKVEQVFYGFEYFIKAMGLMIVTGIFILLWSCLFIVPGIIASIRYSQAFYILADDPRKGVFHCINESKFLMSVNKGKYFHLMLTFIGWGILAILPAIIFSTGISGSTIIDGSTYIMTTGESAVFNILVMIPLIFLSPYIGQAQCVFYDMLRGNIKPGIIEVLGEEIVEEETREEGK